MSELQTLKKDLSKTRIIETHFNPSDLGESEIAVTLERFAFTANNVTYGVAGDTIGYWQFFPPANDTNNEWGCIPMWGLAEVTHSNIEGISVGERIFGYFPAATNLVLNPVKVTDQSFSDGKDHRTELPAVYNNYVRLSGDSSYNKAMDNIRALLFPLHITSFCLCDSLGDNSYYDASQIIIVSASSKTAIGLAQGLSDEKDTPKIVGLTSARNIDFVKSLGCYDEVISYDQLDIVNTDTPTVMVDMAGNREILGTLHGALGDNMHQCLTVGMTHWDNETTAEDHLGKLMQRDRTEFFFAPAHIQKRVNDWGYQGYNDKTSAFMTTRATQSKDWMQVIEISGINNFITTYEEVVAGNMNPSEGVIVLL